MTIIKDGYNNKKLQIRIGNPRDNHAELWIEFNAIPKQETLSYITLSELLELKKKINEVIQEMIK